MMQYRNNVYIIHAWKKTTKCCAWLNLNPNEKLAIMGNINDPMSMGWFCVELKVMSGQILNYPIVLH